MGALMACGVAGACAFERIHAAWQTGDLAGLLAELSDDIEWVVLMDGITMPYVASAVGKEDLTWRLGQLVGTFDIHRFHIDALEHGAECCRSVVSILYVHRSTGEPLEVKLRFAGWQQNGKLTRVEERSDAAYVAVYDRFVRFLESRSDGP